MKPALLALPAFPPYPSLHRTEGRPAVSRRVLVVDDNRDAASSLAMLFELDGHEVVTVHDGAAAFGAAEAHRPDVVLLDIGLPLLDGYAAARAIRAQPWGKGLTLVAVTGWGQEQDRLLSQEAGFDAHLVKPVDHHALMKLLVAPASSLG